MSVAWPTSAQPFMPLERTPHSTADRQMSYKLHTGYGYSRLYRPTAVVQRQQNTLLTTVRTSDIRLDKNGLYYSAVQ